MPVTPSSAYDTVATIGPWVQSLLNDQAGNLYSWPISPATSVLPGQVNLVPYMELAYRRVQRAMANVGSQTFTVDDVILTVPAVSGIDPSQHVYINDGTAPPNQLPVDMLVPLKLWERQSGTTDEFNEMVDMTAKGGIPSMDQTFTLRMWAWTDDQLEFVGALVNVDIRLRYQKQLPKLAADISPILIRNASATVAFLSAGLAAQSRGSPISETLLTEGQMALDAVLSRETRQGQRVGTRRRPYSWRGNIPGQLP